MNNPTGFTDAVSLVKSLVWGDSSAATPPHIRAALASPDVHNVVALMHTSNIGTAGLVRLARSRDRRAELAVYVRYLPMIEATAGRFARGTDAWTTGDAHQEAAIALLELVRDESVTPTRVGERVQFTLTARVADQAARMGRNGLAIPRAALNRVVRALRACEGHPSAAAEWAATIPPVDQRMSRDTFWSVYTAYFMAADSLSVERDTSAPEPTDDGSDLTAVENRVLVEQMFSWRILDKREEDILRRTFLFDRRQRETDEQIALCHGISRARVVQIRKHALAALRTEMEQEGITSTH